MFEFHFKRWLEESLEPQIPETVKAFSFNLDESAYEDGYEFGIELIGAERFDPNDENWACDEIWEPSQRKIFIPVSYSGQTWEECLTRMKKLVVKFLESGSPAAKKLKSSEGVGIGFVDGDLELVWQARAA